MLPHSQSSAVPLCCGKPPGGERREKEGGGKEGGGKEGGGKEGGGKEGGGKEGGGKEGGGKEGGGKEGGGKEGGGKEGEKGGKVRKLTALVCPVQYVTYIRMVWVTKTFPFRF